MPYQPDVDVVDWFAAHDPLPFTNRTNPELVGDDRWNVRSAYQEQCLLPLIGPSALWVLRRLQVGVGVTASVPLEMLAASVGLGHGTGRNSPVVRTLRRLVAWRLAVVSVDDVLTVNTHSGPLSADRLDSLGRVHPALVDVHHRLVQAVPA